jgi:hypothetical protein
LKSWKLDKTENRGIVFLLNKGYRTQASKDFGINRETLWRKIGYPLPQISSLHINIRKFGKKKWPLLDKDPQNCIA